MHRCLKLTLVDALGKHFEGLLKSCCACAKEIDGHLKQKIHQASMDEMTDFIAEMRKLVITMNVDNYHQIRKDREVFEKAVKDVSKACTQARKNVLECVQKKCKGAGKKGEQALEGGVVFN